MPITQVKSKQQFLVTDNVSFQDLYRITGLVNPVNAQDAATKAYVDSVKQALDIKDSARVATTGAETYTIVGGAVTQITGTTIDGVAIALNDRILIKNAPAATGAGAGAGSANTTQPANGIYVVTNAIGNLTVQRSADADVSVDVTAGMFVFVAEGTAGADNGYVLTTNDAINLNTTGLTFTQFSGAGQIVAGDGLTKTGNTINAVGTANRISVSADAIDIDANYAGQNTIVTLGTVTTGTWNATTIAPTRGGTGLTSYVLGDILFASAANTLSALAGNTAASKRFLTQTGNGTVSAAPSWGQIAASDIQSGLALTKTDDTNVTLTLGGTPATALLQAVSLTVGWTGTLAIGRGGTGAANKTDAYDALSPNSTLGDVTYHNGTDNVRLAGNTTTTKQFLTQTGTGTVSAAPAWSTIAGADVTGAALTVANDTNITLTLGGTPATALLRAASITVAWSGTLAVDRGGSGRASATAFMPIAGGTTATGAHQSVSVGTTNGQALLYQGNAALPAFGAITLGDTTGNIVSGILRVVNGGTGQSSYVNGELLIGNTTGNTLTKSTLTAGTGIAITNGAGSITIAVSSAVFTSSNFVTREIPSGAINSSNASFTLANTPTAGTEEVFVNGILQNVGAGNDYTISGATITFLSGAIPQTGDSVLVNYRK
jgi:hypothetical protein